MAPLPSRGSRLLGARLAAIATLVVIGVGGLPGTASPAPVSTRWTMRYDGFANDDQPSDLGVSPDGSTVWVTGFSRNAGETGFDFATVAYDAATGMNLWASRYDGPASAYDQAMALGVSPDGSQVIVTGAARRSARFQSDYATIAYDGATGAEEWVTRYNGPVDGADWPYALALRPDGAVVYVTGMSQGPRGSGTAVVAYSAVSGRQLWVARQEGVDAEAVAVSPDGSTVVVTGARLTGSSENLATMAFDADTGADLWERRYDGPKRLEDYGVVVAVSPDGSQVFVTGNSRQAVRDWDYVTMAYDTGTGAGLWQRRYDGPWSHDDGVQAIDVSPDGSAVFVTGGSRGAPGDNDYATVSYDASSGATTWVRRFDETNIDQVVDLVVSSDGSEVLVTGNNLSALAATYQTTVAYEATTGATRWVLRFGDGSGERVRASAITPDGAEFVVTGSSWGGDAQHNDYATVAFDVP